MTSRTSHHSAARGSGRDKELAALRGRAQSAEDALEALRSGTADAIVATAPTYPVLTFAGSEHPYRAMVEAMSEGAVTVTRDGTILYCNERFAKMVKADQKTIIGSSLPARFADADAATIGKAILGSRHRGSRTRATLLALDGARVPVNVAMHRLAEKENRYVVIVVSDLTDIDAAEIALRRSDGRYRSLVAATTQLVWATDGHGKVVEDLPLWRAFTGQSFAEIQNDGWANAVHPQDREAVINVWMQRQETGSRYETEYRIRRHDGIYRDMSVHGVPIREPEGSVREWVGTCTDITDRKNAEEIALRLNRALLTLSRGNEVLTRAESEVQLFNAMCQIFVDIGGYRMAWVGIAEHDAAKSVTPVAWAGEVGSYLENVGITWADEPRGRGPTGRAIRLGRPQETIDFDTAPEMALWRDATRQQGFASSAAFPLSDASGVIGALTLYSSELKEANSEESRLLQELASDISFGIRALRERRARDESERALAESELRLRTVMDTNVDGIVVVDMETKNFLYANRAFCDQLGYAVDEISALGLADIHPPDVLAGIWRNFKRPPNSEAGSAANIPTKRKDGSILFTDVAASPAMLGGRRYMVACFHDVTERRVAEEKLIAMARYDLLTGLANRSVFVDALVRALALTQRGARGFAVLYLDLDHFKDVNDTLGHPIGDLLLRAVADRLRTVVRATDTVARFGGDEFGILLPDIADPADVAVIADRVKEALAEKFAVEQTAAAAGSVAVKVLHIIGEPFAIQGNDIRTAASIGIAVFGADSTDAETMLSHADVALYRAKSQGRGTYRFFDMAMETEVRARVALGAELREAIASGQLFLVYHPQVDDESGQIVGLEALVRWNHPTRGMVGPGQFIPEAEHNGLIIPLGHWVLREACRQARRWLDAGIAPPVVAVNLSGVQFKRPLELEKDIAATLAETGLPPSSLELELTESVLMEASTEHNDLLMRFHAAGYHISIDDFGTGFSSLDYLSRFPVDRIKIAQSFILDLQANPRNRAIVKAAIGLAHELGLIVVVEGVETAEQLAILKSWGCRLIQGFYFSKPLPVDEMTALLRIGKITRTAADA